MIWYLQITRPPSGGFVHHWITLDKDGRRLIVLDVACSLARTGTPTQAVSFFPVAHRSINSMFSLSHTPAHTDCSYPSFGHQSVAVSTATLFERTDSANASAAAASLKMLITRVSWSWRRRWAVSKYRYNHTVSSNYSCKLQAVQWTTHRWQQRHCSEQRWPPFLLHANFTVAHDSITP